MSEMSCYRVHKELLIAINKKGRINDPAFSMSSVPRELRGE